MPSVLTVYIMDPKKLEKFKTLLLDEKSKLEKDLNIFSNKDQSEPGNYNARFPNFGSDEGENANEVAEYSDRLGLEHTLEDQLRDVNKALARIEKGTYGICQHCGNPIEEARLEIRPTSSSCINCKKRLQGEGGND